MSAELNMSDELEDMRTTCGVCKKPMIVQVPRDPEVRKLFGIAQDLLGGRTLMRVFAHDECLKDRAAMTALEVERERRVELINKWKRICPPEFLAPIDFDICGQSFKGQHDRIMKWVYGGHSIAGSDQKAGLIAFGKTGRCKTRFIFKLCEREILQGREVVYVRHPEFREKVSRLSFHNANDLFYYLKPLRLADILFFDDLGKARITDASEEAIESIIDERTRNGRPIFFTTNEGDESLGARLSQDRGEPMLRRIFDFCDLVNFGFE